MIALRISKQPANSLTQNPSVTFNLPREGGGGAGEGVHDDKKNKLGMSLQQVVVEELKKVCALAFSRRENVRSVFHHQWMERTHVTDTYAW